MVRKEEGPIIVVSYYAIYSCYTLHYTLNGVHRTVLFVNLEGIVHHY